MESLVDMVEGLVTADDLYGMLTGVSEQLGVSRILQMDNGSELISRRLTELCEDQVRWKCFIPPGTLRNKGFVELWNRRRTDERSGAQRVRFGARVLIDCFYKEL